jgi:hypothetical protein
MECKAKCDFCLCCGKAFTTRTLKKYDGVSCGRCYSKARKEFEQWERENFQVSIKPKVSMVPMVSRVPTEILGEDPDHKTWLVMWDDGVSAWHSYRDLKDFDVFQKYVEDQMGWYSSTPELPPLSPNESVSYIC